MDCIKTGKLIFDLRREKNMTQAQLAQLLNISDKTVSKWERGLGCPDVSILPELSHVLGVDIEKMLSGDLARNSFVAGNMKKASYYVCPTCGNIVVSTGDAGVTCCGRLLQKVQAKKAAEGERPTAELIENDWYVTMEHPMTKEHYISFAAFVTGESIEIIKQYPEWEFSVRIPNRRHGTLLWYCVKDGLFYSYL